MKWLALACALAAILPVSGYLRQNPALTLKVWILVGFLPFAIVPLHLYMALVSWPDWPGYVKGAEVSALDLVAIVLYLALPKTTTRLPFRLAMGAYFVAATLSALQSPVPIATLFYAWQLARMFLLYAVVARASFDVRVIQSLLFGMALGLGFEACGSIWERLNSGLLQTGGLLGHQNLLGLMTHLVTLPAAALILAGVGGWRPFLGPVAGLVISILTVSRATIGLEAVGYVVLYALSSFRVWTARKAVLLVVGLAGIGVLTPVVQNLFEERFAKAPIETGGYDERAAFEMAASSMLAENPFGVGANYYVVAANTLGYNLKAGVASVSGSESANVHNIYLLAAAETGWLGLATLLLLLASPLVAALRCGWRARRDPRGDLLLGLGMGLLTVYVHSYFEWIFVSFSPQYLFALNVGLVAGIASQLGYWQTAKSLAQAAPAAARPAIYRAEHRS